MVRNYFSLILFLQLFISSNLSSQTTAIPDAAFEQALIDLGIDSDGIVNGTVATADITNVTYLDISNKSIWNLDGIQDFINLTELYCQNNNLFDVTVSHNTNLKILDCSNQYDDWIEPFTLNVSQNTALEYLNLSNNPDLSEGGINPSLNPSLKTLICSNSGLSSLNVSQNVNLEYLNCSNNYYINRGIGIEPFTNLFLGQNMNLTTINCSINEISNLDLTNLPNLTYLNCAYNNLIGINLTQNTILGELYCNNNQLTSLYLTYNTALNTLKCDSNQLTILNVNNGGNSSLTTFNAQNNPPLTCIEVDDADAANNGMAPYDTWLKDDTATYLEDCDNSTLIPDPIFELALINLGIDSDNTVNGVVATSDIVGITSLDVSSYFDIIDLTGIEDFASLKFLRCIDNRITSLNLAQNTELETLICFNNQISSLIVGQNSKLVYINCESNQLSSLDISGASALTYLDCGANGLTSLVVNQNINLAELKCYGNQLTFLDVSNIQSLNLLMCGGNQIESLDLSQNTNLQGLICENNELTSLNVKNGNNNILYLYALDNPLLTCIQVDDANAANAGEAPYDGWYIDAIVSYSEDCSALGIDDELLAQSISLYPNPVSNILTIDSEILLTKVEIYSILGEKVIEINTDFKSIRTDNLSNGVYVVRMQSVKGNTSKKLIKN